MDYSNLSNGQINYLVANKNLGLEYDKNVLEEYSDWDGYVKIEFPFGGITYFDPCKISSDAQPIIVENRIAVINDTDGNCHAYILDSWPPTPDGECVEAFVYKCKYTDPNPLRAAMIVYLMMKEGE